MKRREFIKKSARYASYAAFGMTLPTVSFSNAFARKKIDMITRDELLHALEVSDVAKANKQLRKMLDEGRDA
jgi:hypothetical protein